MAHPTIVKPLPKADSWEKIPPLHAGDRLSRFEFERRYEAHPEIKKAELIDGVVYMPSPIRYPEHLVPVARGVYQPLQPDAAGMLCSEIFPGLCLNATAFWAGDMVQVLATLQEKLNSPEHAAFVANLQARRQ